MSATWRGAEEPALPPLSMRERARIVWRVMLIVGIVLVTAPLFLMARLVERNVSRRRSITLRIASLVFAAILRVLRIKRIAEGRPSGAALVANHSSWLDVAVLFAGEPLVFVSKSDVASWPIIGPMTRLCGTIYIERRRLEAAQHAERLSEALAAGTRIAFFPEGTSSDGRRVLPFRSSMFAAFTEQSGSENFVQPAGLRYDVPPGRSPTFHAWWGDMPFGPHAFRVLAAPSGGKVVVRYGVPVEAGPDRKALAKSLEARVAELAGLSISRPSPIAAS